MTPAQPYFTALSSTMTTGRTGAVAAPLPGNKVLIAGGSDGMAVRSAEIFDPGTDTFIAVPNLMRLRRSDAVAAPLPDGRVLIAGGLGKEVAFSTAEIFDPRTDVFSEVEAEMTTPRLSAFAVPLPDGDVLVAGGYYEGKGLARGELFDPTTETFTALSEKGGNRSDPIAVSLPDGRPLIFGGYGNSSNPEAGPLSSVETFDPGTDTFSVLNADSGEQRGDAVGAALPDGQILVAGGIDRSNMSVRHAGLLDPRSGAYTALPPSGDTELTTTRTWSVAEPLPNGTVLIAGGGWEGSHETAELFVPAPALEAEGGEFGSQTVGTSSTANVTVRNEGAQSLRIEASSIGGDDADRFRLVSDSCAGQELAFEEGCDLTVMFEPGSSGDFQARIEFEDNEPSPSRAELTGAGAPAAVEPEKPAGQGENQPAPDERRAFSLTCRRHLPRGSGPAMAVCRPGPLTGEWLAVLRHAGHAIARRNLTSPSGRIVFALGPRARGPYRLQLTPR